MIIRSSIFYSRFSIRSIFLNLIGFVQKIFLNRQHCSALSKASWKVLTAGFCRYQHLCRSNKSRLTKKASAYHQLHLLNKTKPNSEDLGNFVRLYGSNRQSQTIKDQKNRSNDNFYFLPQMADVSEFAPFSIAIEDNGVDDHELETMSSVYFPQLLESADEEGNRSDSPQCRRENGRNVPSVDDLLRRECCPGMTYGQNGPSLIGQNGPSLIGQNGPPLTYQEDADGRIYMESSRNRYSFDEMRISEVQRYSDSYTSDSPSPPFSTVSETSCEDLNYEYGTQKARNSAQDYTPRSSQKKIFPLVSFPEEDGAIIIQEMLPTY